MNWQSHPGQAWVGWQRNRFGSDDDRHRERWGGDKDWRSLVMRTTPDGHTIEFGLNGDAFERRPRLIAYTLAALLAMTLLAYLYLRSPAAPAGRHRRGGAALWPWSFCPAHPRAPSPQPR